MACNRNAAWHLSKICFSCAVHASPHQTLGLLARSLIHACKALDFLLAPPLHVRHPVSAWAHPCFTTSNPWAACQVFDSCLQS